MLHGFSLTKRLKQQLVNPLTVAQSNQLVAVIRENIHFI